VATCLRLSDHQPIANHIVIPSNDLQPIMSRGTTWHSIPVLHAESLSHREMYNDLQRALSHAQRVTVVCGAGISTSAGIPVGGLYWSAVVLTYTRQNLQDYRSVAGLYNSQPSELGTDVASRELFDIRNLQRAKSLEAVGRMMARLRIIARDAAPTEGHLYIERLHCHKRLLRCYTQNVDGIQTRGGQDISDYVLGLHGRNDLRCHRCKRLPDGNLRELDERLLSEGLAWCSRCVDRGEWTHCFSACTFQPSSPSGEEGLPLDERRLRRLPPGCLLPDVAWNQDSRDHSSGGQSLDQMQKKDGLADLLLVIGTSIGTKGVAKVVRSLAINVHRHEGAMVYISQGRPSTTGWGEFIDLQLESNIDEWAAEASRQLYTVSVHPSGAL
jgi:NAD-dependent histone deacetylase SIR2